MFVKKYVVCIFIFLSFIRMPQGFGVESSHKFYSSKYPVALAFMVADLKYSQENGVKICEVQQGISSTFTIDRALHQGKGVVPQHLHNALQAFGLHGWAVSGDIKDAGVIDVMKQEKTHWTILRSVEDLRYDKVFKKLSKLSIFDSSSISNYHGLLFARPESLNSVSRFHRLYPGMILIDEPAYKYWNDKLMWGNLLLKDSRVAKIKAEWKNYSKHYTSTLSQNIQHEIPGEIYVIKPRSAFKGRGVIIVHKNDLDNVLYSILSDKKNLKHHQDPDYKYWASDVSDSFIVEKFYASDPILDDTGSGNPYDPTIRVTFILAYDHSTISVYFTGSYFKVPSKSLADSGTLNEKHKSVGHYQFDCGLSEEVAAEIENQLTQPLMLLFEQMLK